MKDDINNKVKEILSCVNVKNSNANVDEYSFGGRKFEAAGLLLKKVAMEDYIPPDIAQAFRENRIYIHDMDNYATGMHNCCKRDTKFITDKGVYSFNDFNDGDEVIVKTHLGRWKKAIVRKMGTQMLNKISLCRSQNIQEEYFTPNHRWILEDGSVTENIKIGDKLYKAPTYDDFNFETATENEKKMWCLGFILGDGCECACWSHGKKNDNKTYIRLRLCGNKIKYANNFDILTHHTATLDNGDLYLTFSSLLDIHKKLPDLEKLSIPEKQALFEGLYNADGNHTGSNMAITTTSEELASFIEDIIPSCGYYILQYKDLTGEETNYGIRGFTKTYNFIKNSNKNYWTVINIEPYKEEEVWCLDVEDDHSFILPNGIVTGNCLFIDFAKLFRDGFTTRNGDVRPPKSIGTAMQQVAVIFQCQSQVQFGGVASAHIDYDLAPFVAMSFKKHFKSGLKYVYDEPLFCYIEEDEWKIGNEELKEKYSKAYNYALDMTEKEGMQAAQGLYHNLNTLESRAGSQLPFTSINFGRDTSEEGRMVTRWLLEASLDGIGKFHRTSIFPIAIFQHKKGINANPGDPNYDLKQLAIKSLCKRIYPNFVNCDFSGNIEDPSNPDTFNCTMGCRTAMSYDRHGFGYAKVGRGNVSPITINLPKIGIKYGIALKQRLTPDIEGFYNELNGTLALVERALVSRFRYICSQSPKAAPFMYKNETIRGFDGQNIASAMRHGSQAVGVLGIAEMCQALFGKNHLDLEVHRFVTSLMQYISNFCKEASNRNDLNFGLYYTPAESCCYTICRRTRDEYGVLPNITDKEFFTNSIHVPVWEEVDVFKKIDIEAPLCKYGTSGCITYTEFESKIMDNPEAVEQIINYAMDKDVPYFAINFPIDTCLNCGYADNVDDECPICHSTNIEHLARVTGYLSTDVSNFNKGKQAEVKYRYKHTKKTFGDDDDKY